jgi:hypothetical protein
LLARWQRERRVQGKLSGSADIEFLFEVTPHAVFKIPRMRTPRSLDASLKHENIS